MNERTTSTERSDFIAALAKQRSLLRRTVEGLSDEQAARRTTASELCLAGIIKHVADAEERWVKFMLQGPEVMTFSPERMAAHAASFQVMPGESLDVLLSRYDDVANRTAEVVASLPSLDDTQPLPDAPWFPPGARWSARTVLAHILAESERSTRDTPTSSESRSTAPRRWAEPIVRAADYELPVMSAR